MRDVFERLYGHYGAQHWWPADNPFEVMVGAILTQNTAWTNVEKGIQQLKAEGLLDARRIVDADHGLLAGCLRPVGYFNVKADRLRNFCVWYLQAGEYQVLASLPTAELRHQLLSINGVGPETADDMLLYAFERPVFVIDAYTRRLFSRLGLIDPDASYEDLRRLFQTRLATGSLEADAPDIDNPDIKNGQEAVTLFNEFHALIVIHAKDVCRKRPLCHQCLLAPGCPEGSGSQ